MDDVVAMRERCVVSVNAEERVVSEVAARVPLQTGDGIRGLQRLPVLERIGQPAPTDAVFQLIAYGEIVGPVVFRR
jgi:hypothetical protein